MELLDGINCCVYLQGSVSISGSISTSSVDGTARDVIDLTGGSRSSQASLCLLSKLNIIILFCSGFSCPDCKEQQETHPDQRQCSQPGRCRPHSVSASFLLLQRCPDLPLPGLPGQFHRGQRERILPRLHYLRPRVLWSLSQLSHQQAREVSHLQETS